ncbi:MAG TPA: DUF3179 domain-containing (seleno)protein [Flavisolibacter sp.]|nr:DUF3179 domain-containing (seleno)protein [Flavisolibacter sp.]
MRRLFMIAGFLLLFVIEILRVYFIMPFPGSQKASTIDFAYWLNRNIFWLRIFGWLLIAYPLYYTLTQRESWKRFLILIPLLIYCVIFYFFNYRFEADKMFYQPTYLSFSNSSIEERPSPADQLVVGVDVNGQAKAYPVQFISYHHQVRDMVGNIPVMVTYCSVCRTGRVYSPMVNGRMESFRLVGMDHFNAMFEDATTKSWWQQATGVAVAGPLKGMSLKEIPSRQSTWSSWLRAHPNSLLMSPDTTFKKQYNDLAHYDKGTMNNSLEKRDTGSWQFKSWVVGVALENAARAYDWNDLVRKGMIQDTIRGVPVLLMLEKDAASFHVWDRKLDGMTLLFEQPAGKDVFSDQNTNSVWDMDGKCFSGPLKGARLQELQASQEFWHSWKNFHPRTSRF